jgi:hypothetical protein
MFDLKLTNQKYVADYDTDSLRRFCPIGETAATAMLLSSELK